MVPSETGLQPHCEIVFRPMASPQVFKKMIRWVVLLIIPGWHITIHLGPKSHLRRNRSETNEGMRFNHTFHCWPRGANPFAAIAHCTLEKPCCVFKARLISSHSAKPSQHPVVSHELFQKTKAAKQLKYCGPTQKQTGHMDPLKPDDAFFSSAFMPVRAMPLLKGRNMPLPCPSPPFSRSFKIRRDWTKIGGGGAIKATKSSAAAHRGRTSSTSTSDPSSRKSRQASAW